MKNFLLLVFLLLSVSGFGQPLWLRYPSISPDGSQIVFSYKGDLFKVSAAGGQAVPLTLHEAHDFMPVWSHDGKNIAFASDRYGNFDVFIMPASGGEAKRITHSSFQDYPTDFSRDNQSVLFQSGRMDPHTSVQFPVGMLGEVYSISINGGNPKQVTAASAELAVFSPSGNKIAYQDNKGYEDYHRKHQTSSIARDIWMYDLTKKKYKRLTNFKGEDRNPVFASESDIYYLSEQPNSFNIFKLNVDNPSQSKAITTLTDHPIRNLTGSDNGLLCFSYNGEIYTVKEGEQPRKVNIVVSTDSRSNDYKNVAIMGGATEFSLSPNGKEFAFVVRGEIFVSAVDGGGSKRITNTPEQERSVSFSSDGKLLVYAAERNGSWDVMKATIVRKEEPYFYSSTLLKEEPVMNSQADEFQPEISPDGKEVAYLEERTTLKVINLASKATRTILPGSYNYSYSDGDQWFAWSPDGKWLIFNFLQKDHWLDEIGVASADGKGEIRNISQSGYDDGMPRFMSGGKMIIYNSWRDGMKSHGSWGATSDIYAIFPTKAFFDRFKLSKQEFALLKEREEKEKKEKDEAKAKEAEKDKKKPKDPKAKADSSKAEETKFDWEGIEDRKMRLTLHSSFLSDAITSKDGEKLYYLCRFEKGMNLWVGNLREKSTKILAPLDAGWAGGLQFDKEGKNLFLISDGKVMKIDPESGKSEPIALGGEMKLDAAKERAYIFNHSWRQVVKKFYRPDLHGVKWDFYKQAYEKFLPHINNGYDFEEMLSELLGELNASHTGAGYRAYKPDGDKTATLCAFYDLNYAGPGLKIAEVIKNGPLDKADLNIKAGAIIEKINGEDIPQNVEWTTLMHNKIGENMLLNIKDADGKSREVVVKPVNMGTQQELLYKRWVRARRDEVEKLSGGRLGYLHVRGMDDRSFRDVYDEALGYNATKEALIVDTRFNGGGWLHDDLATFLSGKKYVDMAPRGQKIGFDPQRKWTKPSVVLMSESNYSDAHFFPFVYKELGIGKLIGMPVPGTATAVWWESQIDPTIYFGIPQVGIMDKTGQYLENTQLEPDVKVEQEPEVFINGRDQQIEKAVEVLLKDLGSKK